jgi:hypothetical protein
LVNQVHFIDFIDKIRTPVHELTKTPEGFLALKKIIEQSNLSEIWFGFSNFTKVCKCLLFKSKKTKTESRDKDIRFYTCKQVRINYRRP